jgi:1-acyl-sn-glycerol-3-phosphate acyltransferase
MGPLQWILTYGCKLGLRMLYRIDASAMDGIRADGPLIVYTNHRSLVEAPLVYTFLRPRKKVTGISKIENFKNPLLGFIFRLWGIIPLRRDETDMEAMRSALAALKDGFILGLAPEGTRSKTGKLQKAHEGVVFLALRAGSPMQPLAHWDDRPLADEQGPTGGPAARRRWPFRRPRFDIRVGRAFRLDPRGQRITREIRQEMTDEIMYQLARLLPEDRRGEYADLGRATEKWLAFED